MSGKSINNLNLIKMLPTYMIHWMLIKLNKPGKKIVFKKHLPIVFSVTKCSLPRLLPAGLGSFPPTFQWYSLPRLNKHFPRDLARSWPTIHASVSDTPTPPDRPGSPPASPESSADPVPPLSCPGTAFQHLGCPGSGNSPSRQASLKLVVCFVCFLHTTL